MSRPITWQNIQGPAANSIGAERGYNFAAEGITDGLDRLAKIFTNQEALASAAQERDREAQALGFKEMLSQARTVEDLDALRTSGQIDAAYNALDPRTRAKVFGAADARRAGLMQETTNNNAFQAQQTDLREAPIRDRIMTLLATDPKAALAELQANPGIRNAAPIAAAIAAGERDATKWGWAQTNQKNAEAREADAVIERQQRQMLAPIQYATAQLTYDNAVAARDAAANAAIDVANARRLDAQMQLLAADNNVYRDGFVSPANTEAIQKLLNDNNIGSPEERGQVTRMVTNWNRPIELKDKNGKVIDRVQVDLPLSLVKSVLVDGKGGGQIRRLFGSGALQADIEEKIQKEMERMFVDTSDPNNPKVRYDRITQNRDYVDLLRRRAIAALPPSEQAAAAAINARPQGQTVDAAIAARVPAEIPPQPTATDAFRRMMIPGTFR